MPDQNRVQESAASGEVERGKEQSLEDASIKEEVGRLTPARTNLHE